MVYICHGYLRKRLVLDCCKFYSKEELFHIARVQHKGAQLSLEYGPNLYQPLSCDVELRFACCMVEAYVSSHQPDEDREADRLQRIEMLHTASFEAKMRRKSRAACGENTDKGKTKLCSMIDIEPILDEHTNADDTNEPV